MKIADKCIDLFFYNIRFRCLCGMLIILAVFICMLILNQHTPLIADDFSYAFSTYDGLRINSVNEIIPSMYAHYMNWGGRVVVHFLAQFFLMYDKSFFDITNTIVFIILILSLYIHGLADKKIILSGILGIILCLFLFLPAFGQDILWLVGACNYLWGPTLALLFLLPYRLNLQNDILLVKTTWSIAGYFVLGLLAGWTNENLAVAVCCGIVSFMYCSYSKRKSLYRWQFIGLLGCCLGATLLIIAPGNFVRLSHFGSVNIWKNLINISLFFFEVDFLLIPCLVALLLLIISKNKKQVCIECFPYFMCLLSSLYSMVVVPFYADRSKIINLVFIVIILMIIYKNFSITTAKDRGYIIVFVMVSLFLITREYQVALNDILIYEKKQQYILDIIDLNKHVGNLDVIVEQNYPYTKYCAAAGLEPISDNPEHWVNKSFARYYGLNTIKTIVCCNENKKP